MISTQVEAVKTRLVQELNVKIKLDWLGDCVNFFKQNDPRIAFDKLYESTKEQLLLANYAHACDPVISNAFRTINTTWNFKEKLFLQMEFIVDISEPFYEQWRRLHDIKLDDVQEVKESRAFQVKKKRCLKLTLFDGLNKLYAMEVRPIPCLTTKLSPGIKVLIKGPVKVSNKIILLEAENIRLIGGEVDEIQIENSYENVLLKLLGRPLTATPKTDYVENMPEIIVPSQSTRPIPSAPINIKPQQVHDDLERLSIDDDDIDYEELDRIEAEFMKKQVLEQPAAKETLIKTNQPVEDSDEEIPESFIRELEEEFARTNAPDQNFLVQDIKVDVKIQQKQISSKVAPPVPVKLQKSPISKPTVSRKLLTNPWTLSKRKTTVSKELLVSVKKPSFIDLQSTAKPSTSRLFQQPKINTPPASKKPPKASELLIPHASLMYPVLDDEDFYNPLGEKRKSNELCVSEPPLKARRLSPPPRRRVTDDDYEYKIDFTYNFLTIDQFVELKVIDKVIKSYAMEVRVEKVIKLKVLKEWVLEVQVKDKWSSKLLNIKIANDIVANFSGCSAQEMTLMHQKAQIQPQLKDDLRTILDRVNTALQNNTLLIVVTTKILPPTGYEVLMSQNLKMTDENRQTIMLKLHDEKIE